MSEVKEVREEKVTRLTRDELKTSGNDRLSSEVARRRSRITSTKRERNSNECVFERCRR